MLNIKIDLDKVEDEDVLDELLSVNDKGDTLGVDGFDSDGNDDTDTGSNLISTVTRSGKRVELKANNMYHWF